MLGDLTRRGFLAATAPAAALGSGVIDVRDYKAAGDGKTDDTAAIQKALDKAAESKAVVHVPTGVFCCSKLKMHPNVGLSGEPTFDYRSWGGSIIRLCDPSVPCLIDVTGAYGTWISGMCLDGANLGSGIHGVCLDQAQQSKREDTIWIERCRIGSFSGDGVHLGLVWVFTIRESYICYNRANGVWIHGWDGFVLNNWISGNRNAGIGCDKASGFWLITANRIEWNRKGQLVGPMSDVSVTGNSFDWSSEAPEISLTNCRDLMFTGNHIDVRGPLSGGAEKVDPFQSSCVRLERVQGLTFVGNGFTTQGRRGCKDYGIVLKGCADSVIANNTMVRAVAKEMVRDLGGNERVIVKDNVGSVWPRPESKKS